MAHILCFHFLFHLILHYSGYIPLKPSNALFACLLFAALECEATDSPALSHSMSWGQKAPG